MSLQVLFSRLGWLISVVMGIYIALGLFERPTWCYTGPCEGPGGAPVPMSGLPYMPIEASGAIDLVCLAVIALEMLIKRLFRGQNTFWHNRWNVLKLALLLVAAVRRPLRPLWRPFWLSTYVTSVLVKKY